jgi:hypothetical protein
VGEAGRIAGRLRIGAEIDHVGEHLGRRMRSCRSRWLEVPATTMMTTDIAAVVTDVGTILLGATLTE